MSKICNVCGAGKPLDEFPLTSKKRGTRRPNCKICHRKESAKWRAENPKTAKACEKRWRDNNMDREREKVRRWRDANRDRFNENARRYFVDNRERLEGYRKEWEAKNREKNLAKYRRYKKRHAGKVNARNKFRHAQKLKAVPAWANLASMSLVYEEAQRLSDKTKVNHHVDHVVPLISEIVCGLHCGANLQIITAEENLRKHNRWWPDMP